MFKVSDKYMNKTCGLHISEYQGTNELGVLGIFTSKGTFIKCACHPHLTRNEYDKIIGLIVSEFVNAGPYETIKHFSKWGDIDVCHIYSFILSRISLSRFSSPISSPQVLTSLSMYCVFQLQV